MKLLDATLFGFTAWRVYLAALILLSYAGFVIWRSRKTMKKVKSKTASAANDDDGDFEEKSMSTIPLTDTQRIDRLHRVVSLKPGEQADLNDLTFGLLKKFRIAFTGIELASGQEFAHIKLELGGASADCGPSVKEVGDNDFLLPRETADEQRCSIRYMCGRDEAVSYLQVKLKKIDLGERSAAFDVLHVRGRRRAA